VVDAMYGECILTCPIASHESLGLSFQTLHWVPSFNVVEHDVDLASGVEARRFWSLL
jgi:hypothetical protein